MCTHVFVALVANSCQFYISYKYLKNLLLMLHFLVDVVCNLILATMHECVNVYDEFLSYKLSSHHYDICVYNS